MGLLLHETSPFKIGIWKIEESVDELYSSLSPHPSYTDFLEGKSVENRKKEWFATRVLLKELLEKEALINHHPNGAPYLEDLPLYISISHTKGYVAIILHHSPVGIDIEYKSDRVLKIKSRFLSPEEEQAVDLHNQINHLLLYWCAKETLFKIMGEEEVEFKECLHIEPFTYNTAGTFQAYETRTPSVNRYTIQYLITDDFVLTYAIAVKLRETKC